MLPSKEALDAERGYVYSIKSKEEMLPSMAFIIGFDKGQELAAEDIIQLRIRIIELEEKLSFANSVCLAVEERLREGKYSAKIHPETSIYMYEKLEEWQDHVGRDRV